MPGCSLPRVRGVWASRRRSSSGSRQRRPVANIDDRCRDCDKGSVRTPAARALRPVQDSAGSAGYDLPETGRSGGTGRRAGLKIRFPPGSVGSIPTFGIKDLCRNVAAPRCSRRRQSNPHTLPETRPSRPSRAHRLPSHRKRAGRFRRVSAAARGAGRAPTAYDHAGRGASRRPRGRSRRKATSIRTGGRARRGARARPR